MKLIIAGGRYFNDYALMKRKCTFLLKNTNSETIEVVSGGATGADSLGERFAKENNYSIKRFPADWNMHGKAAGPIRNKQMAEYGTHLIAFWDGKSRGTKGMIELAKKHNLKIRIVKF